MRRSRTEEPMARFAYRFWSESEAPIGRHDVADGGCSCPGCSGGNLPTPQAYAPPTGGTAANGLPILNWDQAAAQITRDSPGWSFTLGTPSTVTYGFRATAPAVMDGGTGGFARLNQAQIIAAERALALWSEVANITFVRVGSGTTGPGAFTNDATILFGNWTTGLPTINGFAYLPTPGGDGGG